MSSLIEKIHELVDDAIRSGGFTPSMVFMGYEEVSLLIYENELSMWSNHNGLSADSDFEREYIYNLVLDSSIQLSCRTCEVTLVSCNLSSVLAAL